MLVPEKKVLVFVSDFCLGEALLRENGCLGGGGKQSEAIIASVPILH